jgi:hypothetical protein
MEELTAIGRYRGLESLPPLLKSKAEVIKKDAVGVKTFAIRSEYGSKLGHEVKDLPKPCFLFAAFVFRPLASIKLFYWE